MQSPPQTLLRNMIANPNPDKATESLEEFLENCEFDDEEIPSEELAEADAAHQNYLAERDPGKSLKQVRRELLGHG